MSLFIPRHTHGDEGTIVNGYRVPTEEEMMAWQADHGPWAWWNVYGYYGLYFLCALLGFFTLVHLRNKIIYGLRIKSRDNAVSAFPGRRATAFARAFTYPRLPQRWPFTWANQFITIGPLGANILLLAGLIFVTVLCFNNNNNYRPPFYGSPPLALRSEWLAMASLPFIYVLGTKRNLISVMTGVSHDKLQVLHQGLSLNFFYMSAVHTGAMLQQIAVERPWSHTYMLGDIYCSGFIALGFLSWLCFLSFPIIRARLYESFYLLHILSAIFFLGALYWHVFNILNSNAYMDVTIVLFFVAVIVRGVMMAYRNRSKHQARLALMQDDAVKITIPTTLNWTPGQHVFIRFPSIRKFESHPFTIASIPTSKITLSLSGDAEAGDTKKNEIVVLLRPHTGLTLELAKATKDMTVTIPASLDGPYGHAETSFRAYDEVLLLVAGSGVSYGIPVLMDLVQCMNGSPGGSRCAKVELVWVMRKEVVLSWFEADLNAVIKAVKPGSVIVRVFITGETRTDPSGSLSDDNIEKAGSPTNSGIVVGNGRPHVGDIAFETFKNTTGTLGVGVCGPPSFAADASNAVAKAELEIVKGGTTCSEVYLQSEGFTW